MSEPDSPLFAGFDAHPALQELRVRAERRRLSAQSLPPNMPDDVQRLVQELQVHQIELEMQYEELLLAQTEAETSRARYIDLYEFAPIGYCTVAPDGTLQQLNLRACELLGSVRQRLVGRRLALFVPLAGRVAFADFLAQVQQQHTRQTITLEMRRDDGQAIYVRLEGVAATDGAGHPSIRLALADVTEQHRARQALELSERRFRILFEQNQDGMLLMRDNRFVDCNPAALQLLGLTSKEQLLGQSGAAFSPERQPTGQRSDVLAQYYWEVTLRRGYCRFEWCRLRASGEEFWEDILLTAVPEAQGTIVHAAWRDITTEKQATARVRASEERLNMALEASGTGIWSIDSTTSELYCDARAQQIFGLAPASQPTPLRVLQDALHPDDRRCVLEALGKALQKKIPLDLEHRIVQPDGSIRYVSAVGRLLHDEQGNPLRFVGLVRDITAGHEEQAELTYKNRLLEHILAHLPVVLIRLAPSGEYLEMMGNGLRRLQLQDNELVGQNIYALYPQLTEPAQRLLDQHKPVTFTGTTQQPEPPVYFQNYGFFDEQRQQGVVFAIDVTAAEESRRQLQQEKEFTQNLLNNTVDAVAAVDLDLRVTAWNAQIATLLGRSEAEALGCPLAEVLPGFARDPQILALLHRTLAGEATQQLNWQATPQLMYFDLNFVPLRTLGAISGVLLLARDVTERNALLAETNRLKLRQQQEVLSAILTTQEEERRRIAEGLHNGVGQLLYATKLHLDNLPPSQPGQASQKLLSEAIRATRTISFELTPSILEDFGLKMALRELVKRIPANTLDVDLNFSGLEEKLPPLLDIAVYRIMQELLSNVMKHAHAREVFVQVARADDHLHLSVEDDGVGFDAGQMKKAKGIGLPGICTRVELLGGTFTLRTHPGKGTTVTIQLPLAP
ncbi:PAS domain S-box protein [Hymenobacter sp. J193]|uniref:PAS domain S-box protein n=1 Tax=Hymenobacter sp. J193 TaxID=2898429 RepID=UPI002151B047|nr:PAS domain S-box protein [Hymenobacter sp. J193]MCR5887883.1 PAS domain S-box protein [Hymenobacter sp. J193]